MSNDGAAGGPVLPFDPVGFIQECVRHGNVLWTYHITMRLARRFISRDSILAAVDSYELVEAYPNDKYLPSYLILGRRRTGSFHVLFGVDVLGNSVRIVTSYRPDPREWHPDLKTRR